MMILENEHRLHINGTTALVRTGSLNNMIHYTAEINKNIVDDKLKALIIVCKDEAYDTKLNVEQKTELFKWLDTLPIVTIAIADKRCFGKQLELFLISDIRFGGIDLQIEFPEDEDEFIYNLAERCQLVMGKEKDQYELIESRIINKYIDMSDMQNEVESYLHRIIGTKSLYHIKAIKKCFNNYKRLGISSSQELLLEEESKQCATLIVNEYLRRGHKYEG